VGGWAWGAKTFSTESVVELVSGEPHWREPAGFSRFGQYPRPFSRFPPVPPRSLFRGQSPGDQEQPSGLPLMGNSNRFKLSDSLVDNPQLVNAGGAVGRARATFLPASR